MALRFINGEIVDDEAQTMSEDPSLAMSFDPSFGQVTEPSYSSSPVMQKFAPFKYDPIDINSINFNPQKEALQSRIDASRLRADDALQGTIQRGRIDPQTAILDSLVSIAPSLIAGAITGGKHMDVLTGAANDSLGRFGKIQDAEALAAQKAAAEQYGLEAGIMKNDMSRLGQLEQQEALQQMDSIQQNNRNRFETDKTNFIEEQKTERTNLLANRQARGEEIVSDQEAELYAKKRGEPLDTYKGLPRKSVMEVGKDARQSNNQNYGRDMYNLKNSVPGYVDVETGNPIVLQPAAASEMQKKVVEVSRYSGLMNTIANEITKGRDPNTILGEDANVFGNLYSQAFATAREFGNLGARLEGSELKLAQDMIPSLEAGNLIGAVKAGLMGKNDPAKISKVFATLARESLDSQMAEITSGRSKSVQKYQASTPATRSPANEKVPLAGGLDPGQYETPEEYKEAYKESLRKQKGK